MERKFLSNHSFIFAEDVFYQVLKICPSEFQIFWVFLPLYFGGIKMQTTETSLLRTRWFRLLANSLGVCVLVPPLYFVTFYLLWMEWGIKNSFVVLLKVSEWQRTNDKVRLESFDNGSLNATLHRDFVRHTRVPCDQRPINFLYLMV